MLVERVSIKSNEAISNPKPWFVVDWDGATISCPIGNQGGKDCSQVGRIRIDKTVTGAHPDPLKRDELWVYGVELDGTYFFKPNSEVEPVIMAHLAFYSPVDDRLEILEFVEV